jgi:hypothetical protein
MIASFCKIFTIIPSFSDILLGFVAPSLNKLQTSIAGLIILLILNPVPWAHRLHRVATLK